MVEMRVEPRVEKARPGNSSDWIFETSFFINYLSSRA